MNTTPLIEVLKTGFAGLQENQSLAPLILPKKKGGHTVRCRHTIHMECLHIVQPDKVLGAVRERLSRRSTSR